MKDFVFILMVIVSCFCIGLAAGFYVRAEYCRVEYESIQKKLEIIEDYVGTHDEEMMMRIIKKDYGEE